MLENAFIKLENASLRAEWFFFLIGVMFCFVSIVGNGYVSYRLIKIIRISRAIQTPIYLSLTLCGFCTGVFCMPYMLYTLYDKRIVGMMATSDPAINENTTSLPPPYNNYTAPFTIPFTTNFTSPFTTTFNINSTLYTTFPVEVDNLEKSTGKIASCPGQDAIMNMNMFDRVLCNVSGTIFNITSRLIVWVMLLLSIDRYIFICHPYRIHMVKKQHYGLWIALSCIAVIALSFSPYVFYYPDVARINKTVELPGHCPKYIYQPYRTLLHGYCCESKIPITLNTYNKAKLMVFYVFTVVLFLIVPIFLNVILSFKVLYEVSKMKKVGRMAACTVLKQGRTIATTVDTEANNASSTSLFLQPSKQHTRQLSLLRKITISIGAKIEAYQSKHVSSVIENKASFTMLVLSLFYIITYFAWVLVWFATIAGILNIGRSEQEQFWIFLYHSKNTFAYNVMNHYPQATFANAAFVPCLLGYSLHRGRS